MSTRPHYLRTEYAVDPLGLDETEPRFSWLLDDNRRGASQVAYQVVVSSLRDAPHIGDLWDSGRVESGATAHVVYGGAALHAFSSAFWRARIWDTDGQASAWSKVARFELGPLSMTDWNGAIFIRSRVAGDPQTSPPSPFLRRSFRLEGTVLRARLYITALGLYEVSINGRLVTEDVYRPGWTNYHRRVPYQAYDVTGLLSKGENVLGAILGDGWYCGFVGDRRQIWGERPELLAKLRIELDTGETVVVGSDADWRTTTGPIRASDNYDGETYDARLEIRGWDRAGFDDAGWDPVEVAGSAWAVSRQVVASVAPPVRRVLEITPVKVRQRPDATFQFDFGQNIVGRARLRVEAPAGTELTLRFAEMLNADGSLHTQNLFTAKATDRYICRGGGEEIYEPHFTFHGFRYAEVSGSPVSLDKGTLTGVVLHSDAALAGDFTCSNELVNQLQRNIVWGQRGNFLDVPTDCPQRAERLGWTGDIQIFARTSTFNMDVAAFLSKYVTDLRDGQLLVGVDRGTFPIVVPPVSSMAGGPGWADAGVIVPWIVYERYGDLRILERHYTSMLDYVDFLARAARGRTEGTWPGFGDWLSLDAGIDQSESLEDEDRWGGTGRDFLWRVFDAYSTGLVGEAALLLGHLSDAAQLEERRKRVCADLLARYVDADGHLTERTQTAYLLALHFGVLADETQWEAAAKDLVSNIEQVGHLQTGFIGTPYLLHVLSDIGRTDLAYRVLERTEFPGWLYSVTQGATTIWERWDGWTRSHGFKADRMNSFNHYAYGAVGEWLFRVVAGIDTSLDQPGYEHILIRPQPGGTFTSACAHLDTIRGRIGTDWQTDGEQLNLRILLPPNTRATLRLPARKPEQVGEGAVPLDEVDGVYNVRTRAGRVECDAVAGTYELIVREPIIA